MMEKTLGQCPHCGEARNAERGDTSDRLCYRCRSVEERLAEYSLAIQDSTHLKHNSPKASELRGLLDAAYGNPEDEMPLDKIATQLQRLRDDVEASVTLEDYTMARMPIDDVLAFLRAKQPVSQESIPLIPVDVSILRAIHEGKAHFQADIAEQADVSRRTVVKRLKCLKDRELVQLPPGRKTGIELTDRGQLALERAEN